MTDLGSNRGVVRPRLLVFLLFCLLFPVGASVAHELGHFLAGKAVGLDSTLFISHTRHLGRATTGQLLIVSAAGPVVHWLIILVSGAFILLKGYNQFANVGLFAAVRFVSPGVLALIRGGARVATDESKIAAILGIRPVYLTVGEGLVALGVIGLAVWLAASRMDRRYLRLGLLSALCGVGLLLILVALGL